MRLTFHPELLVGRGMCRPRGPRRLRGARAPRRLRGVRGPRRLRGAHGPRNPHGPEVLTPAGWKVTLLPLGGASIWTNQSRRS